MPRRGLLMVQHIVIISGLQAAICLTDFDTQQIDNEVVALENVGVQFGRYGVRRTGTSQINTEIRGYRGERTDTAAGCLLGSYAHLRLVITRDAQDVGG